MLRSCAYCGRIHDSAMVCKKKKETQEKRWANRKQTRAVQFRKSKAWTEKSIRVRRRDKYMCLCCKAGEPGTEKIYNTKELGVHHIVPLEEDYDKRLDDDNLITLCRVHHEACESGNISRERQRSLVLGQAGGAEDAMVL